MTSILFGVLLLTVVSAEAAAPSAPGKHDIIDLVLDEKSSTDPITGPFKLEIMHRGPNPPPQATRAPHRRTAVTSTPRGTQRDGRKGQAEEAHGRRAGGEGQGRD